MKKSINLQLKMSELIYDIQNKTYLTGRSLNQADNHAHIANMQANDDEENADQIMRSITAAYSVLRNCLSEYLVGSEITSTNDLVNSTDNLLLDLEMPSNFNAAVTKSIGEAAHQFIVATAIADWFAITAKGETTDYTGVAEAALKMLEETLSKRSRPGRPSK